MKIKALYLIFFIGGTLFSAISFNELRTYITPDNPHVIEKMHDYGFFTLDETAQILGLALVNGAYNVLNYLRPYIESHREILQAYVDENLFLGSIQLREYLAIMTRWQAISHIPVLNELRLAIRMLDFETVKRLIHNRSLYREIQRHNLNVNFFRGLLHNRSLATLTAADALRINNIESYLNELERILAIPSSSAFLPFLDSISPF